jgi:molybdenum cofactor biosynthesis protein B
LVVPLGPDVGCLFLHFIYYFIYFKTMSHPHADSEMISVGCAVLTVSDSRSPETDFSGQLIQELLLELGHRIVFYEVIRDEPDQIEQRLLDLQEITALESVIINGGTGISPRDNTYDVIERMLDKTLPGFGEIFRYLSYQEIGSRAIASRAVAGCYRNLILFSVPGSTGAVRLAMERLILPELRHLVKQLRQVLPRN